MNTARQRWIDGVCFWEIRNESGKLIETVSHITDGSELRNALQTVGTIDPDKAVFVQCRVIAADEPRFLMRDESGRGWCNEVSYTDFTIDDRAYVNDSSLSDAEEYGDDAQTFGEWLDNSSAGDEYDNEEHNYTVIRIN